MFAFVRLSITMPEDTPPGRRKRTRGSQGRGVRAREPRDKPIHEPVGAARRTDEQEVVVRGRAAGQEFRDGRRLDGGIHAGGMLQEVEYAGRRREGAVVRDLDQIRVAPPGRIARDVGKCRCSSTRRHRRTPGPSRQSRRWARAQCPELCAWFSVNISGNAPMPLTGAGGGLAGRHDDLVVRDVNHRRRQSTFSADASAALRRADRRT